MAFDKLYIEWTDVNTGFFRVGLNLTTGANPAALLTDLQAASNAGIQQWTDGAATVTANATTAGQYDSSQDTAILTFTTAALNAVRVTLPAPPAAIFLADGSTVDATNALIVAIIADVISSVTDSSGNPVTTYVIGVRGFRGKDDH